MKHVALGEYYTRVLFFHLLFTQLAHRSSYFMYESRVVKKWRLEHAEHMSYRLHKSSFEKCYQAGSRLCIEELSSPRIFIFPYTESICRCVKIFFISQFRIKNVGQGSGVICCRAAGTLRCFYDVYVIREREDSLLSINLLFGTANVELLNRFWYLLNFLFRALNAIQYTGTLTLRMTNV